MKKILSIIAAVLIIVIITLFILMKMYVTPDRVKKLLIPAAETALNRKVTLDKINISLFKGIELSNFSIKEADGTTDFLTSKTFVLKYEFLPLLTKKLVINELKILSPTIRIVRDRDGKFNFETIGKKHTKTAKEEKKESEKAEDLPVSLLVNRLIIDHAGFYFRDDKNDLPEVKGTLDIDTDIKGAADGGLLSEGQFDLKLEKVVLKDAPKPIENITVMLKYAANVNLSSDRLILKKADLIIQKIPVSIKGSVMDIMDAPSLDLSMSIPDTNAAPIQKLVSRFTDLKDLSLSGRLGADISLKGRPDKIDTLKAQGSVRLLKMGVAYNKINALFDGGLKINEKAIDIDLNTVCGRNMMQIKGTVDSYMKNQNVKLKLYSKKIVIDELLTALSSANMPSDQTGRGTPQQVPSAAKEPDPVNLTLTAGGEIKIDSAVYQGLAIDNFYMTYRFKDNRLDLKGTGNAGKGDFELKTLVDLSKSGYSYDASGKINSLYLEEIINTFLPKAKDTLFGMFTTNFSLNGKGTLPHNIKRNLAADGDFNIKNGKISTVELTRELSRLLDIRELETVEFTKAEGTFNIKNGTAAIDSTFQSDKLAMNPKGNIGLIDETLNLAFDLKLSPRLTKKTMGSSMTQYIRDKDGWGTVPLVVTGTFSKPKYKVEVKKVGKKIIDTEINKLLEKLWGN